MKRIAVDFENNAEEWWDAAKRADDIPTALLPLIKGDDIDVIDVIVSDDEAAAAMTWAEQLPGWNDGPEYASTALTVSDA